MIRNLCILLSIGLGLTLVNFGCGSDGKEGTTPVNCGSHGTLHDGHCHCDTGYLFSGKTCVTPSEITEICVEEAHVTTDAGTEEHEHKACLCPTTGECPCDHGEVETYATKNYCVPELHAE